MRARGKEDRGDLEGGGRSRAGRLGGAGEHIS